MPEKLLSQTSPSIEKPPFWVFGYGSLIWKPPLDHRGTPERPGRVVTVIEAREWYQLLRDKGEQIQHHTEDDLVWGMAYRINPDHEAEVRAYLDHREKNGYSAVIEKVYAEDPATGEETTIIDQALMYLGRLDNPAFVGYEPPQRLAERIISCHGPSGPNKDYVYHLAEAVRSLYPHVKDDYLFDLEARIKALDGEEGKEEAGMRASVQKVKGEADVEEV